MAKAIRNTLAMIDALRPPDAQAAFTQCGQCWQPATCKKFGCRERDAIVDVSAPGASSND